MITKMYLLYNMIPLIFGNKQTIEFRIHTPTYEVNKILPFIFMNALIVNFTIRNQASILKDKNFLNHYNLSDILFNEIDRHNISNRNIFRDLMSDYIEKRKNYCERQILAGNILGTESEIPASNYIDWLDTQKSKYSISYNTSTTSININDLKPSTIGKPRGYKPKPLVSAESYYSQLSDISNFYKDTWSNSIGIINQIEKLEKIDNSKTNSDDNNPF